MQAMSIAGDEEWSLIPNPVFHVLPDTLSHQRRIHDGHYLSATSPFIPLQTRGEPYIPLLQPTWPSVQYPAIQGVCGLDPLSGLQFHRLASGFEMGRNVTAGNIHGSTHMESTGSEKVVSDSGGSSTLQELPVSAGTRLAEEYLCFPLSATNERNAGVDASEVSSPDHDDIEIGGEADDERADAFDLTLDGDSGDGWRRIVESCTRGEVSSGLRDGEHGDGPEGFLSTTLSMPHPSDGANKFVRRPETLSSEATTAVLDLTERYLQDMTRILVCTLRHNLCPLDVPSTALIENRVPHSLRFDPCGRLWESKSLHTASCCI